MKLGIEINGIVHYEPIYGEDKLTIIQNRDRRKVTAALKMGIRVVVIDVSKIKRLNQERKLEQEKIVDSIIIPALGL